MCGLVGWFGSNTENLAAALGEAVGAIAHRGPDDQGVWLDRAADLGLAHCRLAIQDISPAGHQPMASADGGLVLVFNGEIYNHLQLRERLEKDGLVSWGWRGHSDTETLLAAFRCWGVARTLKAAVGMFAFALWDRQARRLTLGRDRLGEKPLYYGWIGAGLAFASELKALRALPGFTNSIDRLGVAGMMAYNAPPGTTSIYADIHKLGPGCTVDLTPADLRSRRLPPSTPYWRLSDVALAGRQGPLRPGSDEEAVSALEAVLDEAVNSQMISDVPLGAFLSGGIDSSTIVALMQRRSSRPVKTFSIGFHEDAYNEAAHAMAVARHLGTDHHELYVDDRTARDVIPSLPRIYCEPFSDASQIPTFLVARMAHTEVTVSLSGDAGDELFGGYGRYFSAERAWTLMNRLPSPLHAPLGRLLRGLGSPAGERLLAAPRSILPARARAAFGGQRLQRIGHQLLSTETFEDFYRDGFTTMWPAGLVRGVPRDHYPPVPEPPAGLAPFERMMFIDQLGYLPDDILVKVDRAAMAVSLETRVPMLDHRVVEFAWRLPLRYKVRGNVGKWILREVLARHVPTRLTDRPKMGFGVPIDAWLRGPLRDWAETLLAAPRLRQAGWFDVEAVRRCWEDHLAGTFDGQAFLWPVLMFEAWREETLVQSRPSSSRPAAGDIALQIPA